MAQHIRNHAAKLKTFSFGVIVAIGLAILFPQAGASDGWLHTDISSKIGVVIIFLLQGLTLPANKIRRDLLHWRLHVFCQSTIFIWIPLLFYSMTELLSDWLSLDLTVGFLYLAILPTTLSTCVAFTAQAGGNTVGALFNASLANILGIFIVPIAVVFMTSQVGPAQPLLPLLSTIMFMLLLPFLIGQILRPHVLTWVDANKTHFGAINTAIVCFIVYVSFCNAIANDFLQAQGRSWLLIVFIITAAMLVIVTGLVLFAIRVLKFDRATSVSALFCASQKTLAAGVPMAQSIFAQQNNLELGIILLPILIYHPLQIVLGGYLVNRYKK